MRSIKDILSRIHLRKDDDMYGFEWHEYLKYLPRRELAEFCEIDNDFDGTKVKKANVAELKTEMLDYMSFAWEKANNCRGISSWRSLAHYSAWIWLTGEEDFSKEIDRDLWIYEYYGKDILVKICNHYGWDSTQWDDGIRSNVEI